MAGTCGDMECDAEKRLLIHDAYGDFTGWKKANTYIIPKSEMAWDTDGEANRGIGDRRIPRAMQTDMGGNRLPMKDVRPYLGNICVRLLTI